MRRFLPFVISSPLALFAVACGSTPTADSSLGVSGEALSCTSYPQFTYKTYVTGDTVQNVGSAWQCSASYPNSLHCGQAGYEPGASQFWNLVWTQLGTCDAGGGADAGTDAKADTGTDAKADASDSGTADAKTDATDSGADAGPLTAKTVFLKKDFTETVPNEVVNNRAFHPQGVVIERNATSTPDRVYIFDSGNQRILAFKSLGTCSGGTAPGSACTNNGECAGGGSCAITGTKGADLVIGQKDASSATCNGDNTQSLPASASTLCLQPYPRTISVLESPDYASMAVDANRNLYVPDKWNHRIVKYVDPLGTPNATTGAGDAVADMVWGQPDFASRLCNQGGGPTASTLCLNAETTGIHLSGDEAGGGVEVSPDGKVWVTDQGNHRVLRFPAGSKTADLVLGQPNFTSNGWGTECALGAANSGTQLCWPKAIRYNSGTNKLYVVEWRGNDGDAGAEYRVLVYTKPGSGDFTNGMAASEVLIGKNNGTINTAMQMWHRPTGIEFPTGSTNTFWLNDSNDSRILFYTKASGSWKATKVLSQANLAEVGPIDVRCPTGNNSDCNVEEPAGGMGIDSDGNIYVGEAGWPRMVRFPGNPPDAPTTTGSGTATPSNAILFPNQPGMDGLVNANKVSGKGAFSLNNVQLIKYPAGTNPATQMIVFDQYRALFWNNYASKTTGSSADGVLYQPDLNTHDRNNTGGPVLVGLAATSDGSKIFVGVQSRIDVFQGPLTTNKQPFATIPTNVPLRKGGTTGANVNVQGLAYDSVKDVLWIADDNGHRILRMATPLSSARVVNMVIGQPNATSLEANRSKDVANDFTCPTIQPDGFGSISGIRLDTSGNLYVIDASHEGWMCSNNRALEFDAASLLPDANLDFFCNAIDTSCSNPKRAKRVYGPADFTSKDASEGGPPGTPNTPISVSFDASNHMMMTVDGYGNPQNKRVFFYANPVPACTTSGCAVASTKILPLYAAQATDSSFDADGNLVVMDQTWTRVLLFAGSDVSSWMQAP